MRIQKKLKSIISRKKAGGFTPIKSRFNRDKSGFTLVELLVVIAILGLLMGTIAFLIDPNTQFKRARDARRKSDVAQLQTALELYRSDTGVYPKAGGATNTYSAFTNITGLGTNYIGTIPSDPKRTTCPLYIYYVNSGQNAYALFADLENTSDSDATGLKPAPANVGGATVASFSIASGTCSGSTYNYWINNP